MDGRKRRRPGNAPSKAQEFALKGSASTRLGGVDIAAREGVFIHSFICNNCGLHFNLYSWLADRHKSATIWCPECGQRGGHFLHWRAKISDIRGADALDHGRESPGEIFRHCPHPGADSMNDSTIHSGLLVALGRALEGGGEPQTVEDLRRELGLAAGQ